MASKKRRHPDSAAETLEAIESWGDRALAWVTDNPAPVLGTAVAVLLVAGVVGLTRDWSNTGADESAAALARVQQEYRMGMGGTPGSIDVPEPANPETARQIREAAVEGYRDVAAEHPDTPAGAIALLEAGKLQQELGEGDAAIATFEEGLGHVGPEDAIRALLITRIASVHEAAGRYAAAGEQYEKAAAIESYPLRYDALADAARVWTLAGDTDRALAAHARIQAEAPDLKLPPYLEARLTELRRTRPATD